MFVIRSCQTISVEHPQRGFTLFELMIVLVIMAAMMIGIAMTIQTGYARLKADETSRKIAYIKQALELFRSLEGRYPCPHLPDTFVNAVETTGREGCLSGHAVVTDINGWAGTRPVGKIPGDNAEILYGVLPRYVFVTNKDGVMEWRSFFDYAKINDFIVNDFKDPWGGDIYYAVTNTLTDTIETEEQGAIPIKDGSGEDTGGVKSNANYAIVFQGPNKGGANDFFALDQCIHGTFACYDADEGDGFGKDWAGIVLPGRKVGGLGIDVATADDIVFYVTDTENYHWVNRSTPESGDTVSTRGDISAVLIKKATPVDANAKLDVAGRLYSEESVRASQLCAKDATNCFTPESLVYGSDGTSSGIRCATDGEYMTGITVDTTTSPPRLKAVCAPLEFDFSNIDENMRKCASGKLYGIWTNGTVKCL